MNKQDPNKTTYVGHYIDTVDEVKYSVTYQYQLENGFIVWEKEVERRVYDSINPNK